MIIIIIGHYKIYTCDDRVTTGGYIVYHELARHKRITTRHNRARTLS